MFMTLLGVTLLGIKHLTSGLMIACFVFCVCSMFCFYFSSACDLSSGSYSKSVLRGSVWEELWEVQKSGAVCGYAHSD